MSKTKEIAVAAPTTNGAINTMAERLGVEATSLFLKSLRDVAFKSPNATMKNGPNDVNPLYAVLWNP